MKDPLDKWPQVIIWPMFYTVGLALYFVNGLREAYRDFLVERDAIRAHYRAKNK